MARRTTDNGPLALGCVFLALLLLVSGLLAWAWLVFQVVIWVREVAA